MRENADHKYSEKRGWGLLPNNKKVLEDAKEELGKLLYYKISKKEENPRKIL